MAKWDEQLTFEEVKVGDELPELALPLTVQRLVMEAAANRDFVPLHHDDAAAQRTGAPAMFCQHVVLHGSQREAFARVGWT